MTEKSELRRLRTPAKRYARAHRLALHQALDIVAAQLSFSSWAKLVAASKKGWEVDDAAVAHVEAFTASALPPATLRSGDPVEMGCRLAALDEADHGMIGEIEYRLYDVLDDVVMSGEGWSIRLPEDSVAIPIVETYTAPGANCPVFDPEFLQTALKIARDRAGQVRARISTDWPRRSTKPDADGIVRHPLSGSESNIWFCYHCDGKITGAQIAQNLWHCPGCGASPLDIYDLAFWAEDKGRSLLPIKTGGANPLGEPALQIVDGRPKLDLTPDKIVLLVRAALAEDATNVSERMGALHAEIGVDDENDVWVVLDIDLWPEDKVPEQALAVAEVLGIEIDVACTQFTAPFAWPGLGEVAASTSDYTKMMLDAYAQFDGVS